MKEIPGRSEHPGGGRLPLQGRRVVVTRPRAQAEGLATALAALGAEVLTMPTIRIAPPFDPEPLHREAGDPGRFDWIVFTSVNGVAGFWEALRETGLDTRSLAGVSLCAVGPATAAAIELEGARADLVPERAVGEAVLEALAAEVDLRATRILLPRAEAARSDLPAGLRERGAEVVEVAAYRTVAESGGLDDLRHQMQAGLVDLITFASSSAVQNFVAQMGVELGRAEVACIGPITSATARELGLPVHVEASVHTVPGLVSAIHAHAVRGQQPR